MYIRELVPILFLIAGRIAGGDSTLVVATPEKCQAACAAAATDGCRFWTWDNTRCQLSSNEAGNIVPGGPAAKTGFPNSMVPGEGMILVAASRVSGGSCYSDHQYPSDCFRCCKAKYYYGYFNRYYRRHRG